jgi:hypothetical protein
MTTTQLTFTGDARVTVQSTSSSKAERFVVQGSLTDGIVAGTAGLFLDVVANGTQAWVLKLQFLSTSTQVWTDGEVRLGARTVTGARVTQMVEQEDDLSAGSDRDFNDLIVRVESVGTFSVPVAPMGIWPATLQVTPEGICDSAFGRHLLAVTVKNTGTENFSANAAVRLTDRCRQWLTAAGIVLTDTWSTTDAAVIGQTVTGAYATVGALRPGDSKRVYFKVDVAKAPARVYPIELQVGDPADAAGVVAPVARAQFLVSRTAFDACQNAFVTSCNQGSVTLAFRGLAVDRHTWKKAVGGALVQFQAAAPAGQPCSPVVLERARRGFNDFLCQSGQDVCGPFKDLDSCCGQAPPAPPADEDWIGKGGSNLEQVVLGTDLSYRIDYKPGFTGQFGPLAYDSVLWRALIMMANAVLSATASAALVGELAALGEQFAIGTVKRTVSNALAVAPASPPAATADGSVDAAVVALDGSRALPGALFAVLDAAANEANTLPIQALGARIQLAGSVMTNAELATIIAAAATDPDGLKVYKSGAATGVTRGILQALVPVTPRGSNGKVTYFVNQVTIAPDSGSPPADGDLVGAGDSGALWIHTRTGKIVALQHAATTSGLAVATRMADVIKALNIRFA